MVNLTGHEWQNWNPFPFLDAWETVSKGENSIRWERLVWEAPGSLGAGRHWEGELFICSNFNGKWLEGFKKRCNTKEGMCENNNVLLYVEGISRITREDPKGKKRRKTRRRRQVLGQRRWESKSPQTSEKDVDVFRCFLTSPRVLCAHSRPFASLFPQNSDFQLESWV